MTESPKESLPVASPPTTFRQPTRFIGPASVATKSAETLPEFFAHLVLSAPIFAAAVAARDGSSAASRPACNPMRTSPLPLRLPVVPDPRSSHFAVSIPSLSYLLCQAVLLVRTGKLQPLVRGSLRVGGRRWGSLPGRGRILVLRGSGRAFRGRIQAQLDCRGLAPALPIHQVREAQLPSVRACDRSTFLCLLPGCNRIRLRLESWSRLHFGAGLARLLPIELRASALQTEPPRRAAENQNWPWRALQRRCSAGCAARPTPLRCVRVGLRSARFNCRRRGFQMAVRTVLAITVKVRSQGCDFARMFVWRVAFP